MHTIQSHLYKISFKKFVDSNKKQMDERLHRRMAGDWESDVYVGYPKYGDDFMGIYIKKLCLTN